MTKTTPSGSASSAPIKTYKASYGNSGEAASQTRCQIFAFEDFLAPGKPPPARHSTIEDLVAEWDQDPAGQAELAEGRRWVADSFYGEEGVTVRSLRLNKGWSQTQLADMLSTSQSHIARIERGTENLTIETCRKLARALEIDMNLLDQALRRQEVLARSGQR